jgi:hypothetical protein
VGDLLSEELHGGNVVSLRDADKDDKTRPNLSDQFVCDVNGAARHALNQSAHMFAKSPFLCYDFPAPARLDLCE